MPASVSGVGGGSECRSDGVVGVVGDGVVGVVGGEDMLERE